MPFEVGLGPSVYFADLLKRIWPTEKIELPIILSDPPKTVVGKEPLLCASSAYVINCAPYNLITLDALMPPLVMKTVETNEEHAVFFDPNFNHCRASMEAFPPLVVIKIILLKLTLFVISIRQLVTRTMF